MKKLTQSEVENRVKEATKGKNRLLGIYINKRTKTRVECTICKYKWDIIVETLYKGHRCPNCTGNIKKNTDIVKKEIFDLVGNEYTVLGSYIDTHTPILFRHNICGTEFKMSPKSFIHGNQRCPAERYIKSAKSNRIVKGNIIKRNQQLYNICSKEGYEIINDFTNTKYATIIHKKCGKQIRITAYRFIDCNIRCSCLCRSKGEEYINNWLKINNYEFKTQVKFDNCRGLKQRLRFDFGIYYKEKLIALIEYDGAQHFIPKFGEEKFISTKKNDEIKDEFCLKNNIKLIRIRYIRTDNYKKFCNEMSQIMIDVSKDINMVIPSQDL